MTSTDLQGSTQGYDSILSGNLKTEDEDMPHFSGHEPSPESCLEKPRNQFAFLMFGLGMLLPWNAMLAAMDFFEVEFPDYKPQFSLLCAVSVPLFFVQVLVYFFLQYIPMQISLTGTFAVNTLITVLLVLLPLVVANQTLGYYLVLLLSVLFGSSYAIL